MSNQGQENRSVNPFFLMIMGNEGNDKSDKWD